MRILIACECSGKVRDAFIAKGHDAMSCDILPTRSHGPHYQGDVFDIIDDGWGMMIAHPPCTFLTLAGVRWLYHPEDTHLPSCERRRHPKYPLRMLDFVQGVEFFKRLQEANIDKICIENSQPLQLATEMVGRYTQKVQPWMFGEAYTKGACLWLKNLPALIPTHGKGDYEKITAKCHHESPGPDRAMKRSDTYQSIADAMASSWG